MAWRKKSKKTNPVLNMTEEELEAADAKVAEEMKSQLPLSRVKKVIQMNPDIAMVNSDALQHIGKAAELFIKELGNAANQFAAQEKRKTIQPKDIEKAISKNWGFAFLEDALDGWPTIEPRKRKIGGNSKSSGKASQSESQEETILEGEEEAEEEGEEHNESQPEEDVDEDVADDVRDDDDDELPETVPEVGEEDDKTDQEKRPLRDPFAEQF